MRDISGKREGFSICCTTPSFSNNSYTTVGAVVIKSISYSRSKRSCTISICNKPKKPHLKPKPNAVEFSGSNKRDASFKLSFSSAVRSASNWLDSTGYNPANTCGLTSLKPVNACAAGLLTSVTVSPTFALLSSLIPAIIKPTSPALKAVFCNDFGVNTPTCSHKNSAFVAIKRILSLGFNTPSITRTSITTPT